MSTPHAKLAEALEKLTAARVKGIVRHDTLTRTYRERLTKAGFLAEISKGWYYVSNPTIHEGSTAWFGHYWEFVRQYLGERFGNDLLTEEPDASLRAVLGHFIFVFVHPYADGNGRLGRFLMNAMLASGGYPWTVIHLANRPAYLASLELASVDREIRPFAEFVASEIPTTEEKFADNIETISQRAHTGR